jgi:hypothetical protein
MKPVRMCLFLACLLTLLGCTSQQVPTTSVATRTPTPAPTSTLPPLDYPPLTVAQAWGSGHISKFPVTFGNQDFNAGGNYGENTISDDGQMCGDIESAIATTDPAKILQQVESVALMNLHTGVVTTIRTFPPGWQVLSCALTGPWLIWQQAYGATYESFQMTWKIMALNLQTQELRQLDQSLLPNGQPAPPVILPYPSASNSTVVWTTFADNQADTEAVRYDLATGQKTVLARNARFPIISWPWVAWGDGTKQGIEFENLETQQQVFLDQRPSGSALDGTSFVEADGMYSTITLYPSITPDQIGTSEEVGQGINGDFVQFPTLNDRLVTWDSNYSLFAFDRKLQRLVQISGIFGNPQPYISSHFMVWRQFASQANMNAFSQGGIGQFILYVIDTNTLP